MLLQEPVLLSSCKNIVEPKFNSELKHFLGTDELPYQSFIDVIENRSSTRKFKKVDEKLWGTLLYHSFRRKSSCLSDLGHEICFKNVPSPGALQSITLIFHDPESMEWFYYDDKKHALYQIFGVKDKLNQFASTCTAIIPESKNSWLMWYVCNTQKLELKYQSAESLVLREAGSIAMLQNLLASYLGLNFCQLGINGIEEAAMLTDCGKLLGVGAALLDSPILKF